MSRIYEIKIFFYPEKRFIFFELGMPSRDLLSTSVVLASKIFAPAALQLDNYEVTFVSLHHIGQPTLSYTVIFCLHPLPLLFTQYVDGLYSRQISPAADFSIRVYILSYL